MYSVTIGTDESEITQSGDADAQLEMGYEVDLRSQPNLRCFDSLGETR